ncbi:MAG: hypothetical protein ACKVVP_15995 [Chloroflexota bacterium]
MLEVGQIINLNDDRSPRMTLKRIVNDPKCADTGLGHPEWFHLLREELIKIFLLSEPDVTLNREAHGHGLTLRLERSNAVGDTFQIAVSSGSECMTPDYERNIACASAAKSLPHLGHRKITSLIDRPIRLTR